MFALAPECGWTLACSAPKSALTRSMASASMSVSGSALEGNGITDLQGSGGRSEVGFEVGELGDAAGVATALERRREERREDLLGEPRADDAGPDGQHVGVVVGTRHARRVEI